MMLVTLGGTLFLQERRKALKDNGLRARRLTGSDLKPCHWDRFYEFYLNTCEKRWGQVRRPSGCHFPYDRHSILINLQKTAVAVYDVKPGS